MKTGPWALICWIPRGMFQAGAGGSESRQSRSQTREDGRSSRSQVEYTLGLSGIQCVTYVCEGEDVFGPVSRKSRKI